MGCTAKVDQTWPNMGCSTNNKRQILRDRAKEVLKQQAQELAATWNTTSPNNFPTMGNVIGKLTSMSLALQMWVQTVCWNRCSGSVSGLSIRLGLLRLLSCTFVVSRRPHWILDQKGGFQDVPSTVSSIFPKDGELRWIKLLALQWWLTQFHPCPACSSTDWVSKGRVGEPGQTSQSQSGFVSSSPARQLSETLSECVVFVSLPGWLRHESGPMFRDRWLAVCSWRRFISKAGMKGKTPPEDYRDELSWVGVWQEVRTATNIHCGHWCILCVVHIYIYMTLYIDIFTCIYIYTYTHTVCMYVYIHLFS